VLRESIIFSCLLQTYIFCIMIHLDKFMVCLRLCYDGCWWSLMLMLCSFYREVLVGSSCGYCCILLFIYCWSLMLVWFPHVGLLLLLLEVFDWICCFEC